MSLALHTRAFPHRFTDHRLFSSFHSLIQPPARPLDPSSRWTTVTELVSLNTPPLANGLLYIYINDTLVLAQTGLSWRTDESVILSRVLFSTFFGGSSKSYYPPKDEQAFFKGFTVSWCSFLSLDAPLARVSTPTLAILRRRSTPPIRRPTPPDPPSTLPSTLRRAHPRPHHYLSPSPGSFPSLSHSSFIRSSHRGSCRGRDFLLVVDRGVDSGIFVIAASVTDDHRRCSQNVEARRSAEIRGLPGEEASRG